MLQINKKLMNRTIIICRYFVRIFQIIPPFFNLMYTESMLMAFYRNLSIAQN